MNKQVMKHRAPPPAIAYQVLVLACLANMGSCIGYDLPAALNRHFQDYLNVPFFEYARNLNYFYSAYAIPNIILPLFTGVWVAKGASRVMCWLTACIFFANLIFAIGASSRSFPVMILGRTLLGVGAESLTILQSTIITRFFMNTTKYSFALSTSMAVTRFYSILDYTFMPRLADWLGVEKVLWSAAFISVISYMSALGLIIMEREHDQYRSGVYLQDSEKYASKASDLNITPTEEMFSPPPYTGLPSQNNARLVTQSGLRQVQETMEHFPQTYWYLLVTVMTYTTSVLAYLPLASDFYQHLHRDISPPEANMYATLPDTIALILLPFANVFASDDWKHNLRISGAFLISAHAIWGWTSFHPLLPTILLGIGYTLFGAIIYTVMGELVMEADGRHTKPYEFNPDVVVTTAYGISGCFLNLAFSVIPLVVAWLMSWDAGDQVMAYRRVEFFFTTLCLCGFFALK